jgi:Tol biopolymer transport system component
MCAVIRRWAAVVAIGAALVASTPAPAASGSDGRKPAGYIMFGRWHHGREELALVAPDGKVTALASGNISRAAWSSDGTQVVMARYEGTPSDAPSQLWNMRSLSGTAIRAYTPPQAGTQDLDPVWSPSGVTIAFVRRVGGSSRVQYVVGTSEGGQPVTSADEHPGSEYWPKFSRTGRFVAFLRTVDQRTDLVVVRVRTGEEWTVTTSGTVTNGYSWTPDESLVYVNGDSSHGDLFEVQSDGSGTRRLSDDGDPKFTPEVSPDGKRVAFTQAAPTLDIRLLDLRDGSTREVTRGRRRHVDPVWSPDGRFLAYVDAPPEQAKLVKDEAPTSIVRLDMAHLDRPPHVLVTGKTEVLPISWQPTISNTFFRTGGKIPYPRG